MRTAALFSLAALPLAAGVAQVALTTSLALTPEVPWAIFIASAACSSCVLAALALRDEFHIGPRLAWAAALVAAASPVPFTVSTARETFGTLDLEPEIWRPVLHALHASCLLFASLAVVVATVALSSSRDISRGASTAALACAPPAVLGIAAACAGFGPAALPFVVVIVVTCALTGLAAFAAKPAPTALLVAAPALLAAAAVVAAAVVAAYCVVEGGAVTALVSLELLALVVATGCAPLVVIGGALLRERLRRAPRVVGAFAEPAVAMTADVRAAR